MRVDKRTHRHLVEPISGCLHLKPMLLSRYVKFYFSLVNSNTFTIRFLARLYEKDLRTTLGKTLKHLLDECNLSNDFKNLSPNMIKKTIVYFTTMAELLWKNTLAKELLRAKSDELLVDGFIKD